MKKSRFSEEQIIGILKEQEAGVTVAELCRKHGMSDASFYTWKASGSALTGESCVGFPWARRDASLAHARWHLDHTEPVRPHSP